MYITRGTVECPHCGNYTNAKAVWEPQKCKYCRRLYKVTYMGKPNKHSKRNIGEGEDVPTWEAEAADFGDRHANAGHAGTRRY